MKIGTSGTGKPTGALKRAYDLMVELGRTKKNKPEQGTFCYCPRCKTELISSGSFVSDEELVTYKCSLCDTVQCVVFSDKEFKEKFEEEQ